MKIKLFCIALLIAGTIINCSDNNNSNPASQTSSFSDKVDMLTAMQQIVSNEVKGSIVSQLLPYLQDLHISTGNKRGSLERVLDVHNATNNPHSASIFGQAGESSVYPSRISVSRAILYSSAPLSIQEKIANIVHAIRPGLIQSNPEGSLIVRYHDEPKQAVMATIVNHYNSLPTTAANNFVPVNPGTGNDARSMAPMSQEQLDAFFTRVFHGIPNIAEEQPGWLPALDFTPPSPDTR